MARMAGAGEVAGSNGREITPEEMPEDVFADVQLDRIPAKPRTDAEFVAAYGHPRACLKTGSCECSPFATAPRRIEPSERLAWPHWRTKLASDRARAAFEEWCADHDLLDDRGRAPVEFERDRAA